jgi:hypothetical protein
VTTTTLAWHGDAALKDAVMLRMRQHREADEIVQGTYQRLDPETASGYRGCAIGCTLPQQPIAYNSDGVAYLRDPEDGNWQAEVESLYGIPTYIGLRIDWAFEDLPTEDCAEFAVAVIDAIPVGADLSTLTRELGYPDCTDGTDFAAEVREYAAAFIALLSAAPIPAGVPE